MWFPIHGDDALKVRAHKEFFFSSCRSIGRVNILHFSAISIGRPYGLGFQITWLHGRVGVPNTVYHSCVLIRRDDGF